jgi:hypothetical protein
MTHTNTHLRAVFAALFCLAAACGVYAFPGIDAYLPESSGFYVYYRDYSFERESYVGFLQYDEGTYATRYYAPVVAGLPAEEVGILFTVDTSKTVTELTGEEFTTKIVTQDHVDIVNYLHDLIYEISSRRRKISDWTKQNTAAKATNEHIFLFGGNVVMRYEYYVPIFNLFSVTKPPSENSPGDPLFVLSTQGLLQSQEDRAFADFTGMPQSPQTQSLQASPFSSGAARRPLSLGECEFALDAQWTQPVPDEPGLWTLGDDAVFYAGTTVVMPPAGKTLDDIPYTGLDFYSRDHLMSPQELYIQSAKTTSERVGNSIKIFAPYFSPVTGAWMSNFYLIAQKGGTIYLFSFAIFEKSYSANKSYFDSLVNGIFKALQ